MDTHHKITSSDSRKRRIDARDDYIPVSGGLAYNHGSSPTTLAASRVGAPVAAAAPPRPAASSRRHHHHPPDKPHDGKQLLTFPAQTSLVPSKEQGQDNVSLGDGKKLDRILANRRSARRSRERRKQLQENLEKSVSFLTKQNEVLCLENKQLKEELGLLMNVFQKMSLEVLGSLDSSTSHCHSSSNPFAIPNARMLVPDNHNSSLASLQELLLYIAATANSTTNATASSSTTNSYNNCNNNKDKY
jgi:hypothetical protein